LQKEPGKRYQSAYDLANNLRQLATHEARLDNPKGHTESS
jgi:hypothetical protein